MSKIDQTFLEQTVNILENGETYVNERRKVTRLEVPKIDFKHKSSDGFPALSLRKLYFKSIIGELIWFLRGDNHTKYLTDNKIPIWNGDACNWYNKENGTNLTEEEFTSKIRNYSVGQNYSIQYRDYGGQLDQVKSLIDGMIKNIRSSRAIVQAYNPLEVNKTALPPCHTGYQTVGTNDGFWLSFNMRSWDWFLGAPFNIASYHVLGEIFSLITKIPFLGVLATGHCVHLYENQIEAAKELVKIDVYKHGKCELVISDKVKALCKHYDGDLDYIFNNMNIEDFKLVNYTHDKEIRVKMTAPISI